MVAERENKFRFQGFEIPAYMREGLRLYVEEGIPPGSFLTSVIENDLMQAVDRADDRNIRNLPAYANYFYNHTPSACHGSREKMKAWIEACRKKREAAMNATGVNYSNKCPECGSETTTRDDVKRC